MYAPQILIEAALNGLMTGAVYALIALGLTLVYGVLHIINFAHGAMLTAAMFAVYVALRRMLGTSIPIRRCSVIDARCCSSRSAMGCSAS